MKIKWVRLLSGILFGLVFIGCSGREDPDKNACEKLELKCTNSRADDLLNFELNKKIEIYVNQRDSNLVSKLESINNRLSKFSKSSFPVNVISYINIPNYRVYGSPGKEKLDGVKVYSGSANLFDQGIEVREGVGQASKYRDISDECIKIQIIKCKIAYSGKIYGVWTDKGKDSSSIVLSGWIELEDVIVLPITLQEAKITIRSSVQQEVKRLIWGSKGDISWRQIENLVDQQIESIQ